MHDLAYALWAWRLAVESTRRWNLFVMCMMCMILRAALHSCMSYGCMSLAQILDRVCRVSGRLDSPVLHQVCARAHAHHACTCDELAVLSRIHRNIYTPPSAVSLPEDASGDRQESQVLGRLLS